MDYHSLYIVKSSLFLEPEREKKKRTFEIWYILRKEGLEKLTLTGHRWKPKRVSFKILSPSPKVPSTWGSTSPGESWVYCPAPVASPKDDMPRGIRQFFSGIAVKPNLNGPCVAFGSKVGEPKNVRIKRRQGKTSNKILNEFGGIDDRAVAKSQTLLWDKRDMKNIVPGFIVLLVKTRFVCLWLSNQNW